MQQLVEEYERIALDNPDVCEIPLRKPGEQSSDTGGVDVDREDADLRMCGRLLERCIAHSETDIDNHFTFIEMLCKWHGFVQWDEMRTARDGGNLFLRIATATGFERLDSAVHGHIVILLASCRADEA